MVLGIACVLALVLFALRIIMHHSAATFTRASGPPPRAFLVTSVETATGPLTGADAWLQVLSSRWRWRWRRR